MERFKFRNLVDPYIPSRKCGAEVAAAAALSNMALTAFSADRAAVQQTNALNVSAAENQKNREFQAEQAGINRQYNTSERLAQQEYQTGQLQSLMQYNKQLQSPTYQSAQLQAAGINPGVYFSNHATFSGGASPGANAPSGPGVPGTPSGSSGLTSVNPVVPDWASSMMVGANIAKTMSEAGMNKEQTNLIFEKVFSEKMTRKGIELDNMIKESRLPYEAKKLWSSILSDVTMSGMYQSLGKKYESDIDVNQSIISLNKALEDYHGANADVMRRTLWELKNDWELRKALKASEIHKNEGEAALSGAMAETENQLRVFKKGLSAAEFNKKLGEIRSVDLSNKGQAIDNLRKITGLSDAVWNDIWNKIKLKTGAVDHDALEKYLKENGLD